MYAGSGGYTYDESSARPSGRRLYGAEGAGRAGSFIERLLQVAERALGCAPPHLGRGRIEQSAFKGIE